MPALENARYEAFCVAVAQGKTADESYVLAGYKENRGNASTLKSKEIILNRISEIRTEIAKRTELALARQIEKRTEMSLDRLSDMFVEDRTLARDLGQMSAAVSAVDKLARLHGYMVDRSVSMNLTAQMSDDELAAVVRAWQQQTAAPALERSEPRLEAATADKPSKRKARRKAKRSRT